MTVAESAAGGGNNNKKVMFKNSAPFSDCKSETNNTQVDIHKDIDVVATIYNLIEHSNSYLDTFGSLWQYYRDEPSLANNAIVDFAGANNNSKSFKYKQRITCETDANRTKNVEIMVLFKQNI